VEDGAGARPARAGDRRAAPEEARQAQAPQPRAHRQVLRVASPEVKALTSPSLLLPLFPFGCAAVEFCSNSPSPTFAQFYSVLSNVDWVAVLMDSFILMFAISHENLIIIAVFLLSKLICEILV
jgi:hypothetical protein